MDACRRLLVGGPEGGRIDRDSPIALYAQLRHLLQDDILSGRLKPGDPLPPDRELCARHHVSRITVTRALSELVQMGLVRRIQGKGSVVAQTRIRRDFSQVMGLTETLRRQGLSTRAAMLALTPDASLPKEFGLHRGPFTRLHRLRHIGAIPAVLSTSYIAAEIVAGLTASDLETRSLYDLIERRLGRAIIRNDQAMMPTVATAEVARLLGVPRGSPHMAFRGTTYVEGGRAVEFTHSIFRGDVFEFHASVRRDDQGFTQPSGTLLAVNV